MSKSWLEQMDTPVALVVPVRGQSHFNKSAQPARVQGHCLPGRSNHSWLNGRCYWCNKPRTAK